MRTSIDMRGHRPDRRSLGRLGACVCGLALLAGLAGGCAGSGQAGPAISPQRQEASANFDSGELRSIGYSRGWRAYPIVSRC